MIPMNTNMPGCRLAGKFQDTVRSLKWDINNADTQTLSTAASFPTSRSSSALCSKPLGAN